MAKQVKNIGLGKTTIQPGQKPKPEETNWPKLNKNTVANPKATSKAPAKPKAAPKRKTKEPETLDYSEMVPRQPFHNRVKNPKRFDNKGKSKF